MQKLQTAGLTQVVREEVRRQMRRYAMARTREEFINRLVEVLGPALAHYYRTLLATLNNRTDQVEKWQQHQEGFLQQFRIRLFEQTKAKRLDKRKAVEQALRELMEDDEGRRRSESADFQECYKLKALTRLPENADEEFLARVWRIVDAAIPLR